MSNIVERVARAICAEQSMPLQCGWSEEERREYTAANWKDYEPEARAAIAAMREGTAVMLEAAEGIAVGSDWLDKASAAACWHQMIDAALGEDNGTK